jgi:hypothetical protein
MTAKPAGEREDEARHKARHIDNQNRSDPTIGSAFIVQNYINLINDLQLHFVVSDASLRIDYLDFEPQLYSDVCSRTGIRRLKQYSTVMRDK